MSRFLETIRILDGKPQHLPWHQQRVDATLRYFYPKTSSEPGAFPLFDILLSCQIPREGTHRCRILYDANTLEVEFKAYTLAEIHALQLVAAPEGYDYSFKYADRSVIDLLYAQRGAADDVLITRDGYITDTSIANIAFRKDDRWYTPARPQLAGTTWKRLVSEGILIPRPIHQDEVYRYDGFRVFNAMMEWGAREQRIEGIRE